MPRTPFTPPPTPPVALRALIKDAAHEAELRTAVTTEEGLKTLAELVRAPVEARLRKEGLKPQAVPPGAVEHKLEVKRFLEGGPGFAAAMNALADEVVAGFLRMHGQVSTRQGFVSGELTITPFEEGGRRGLFFVERAYTPAPPAPATPAPKEGSPS